MSYQIQAQLREDTGFQSRIRSAMFEHALSFQPRVTPFSGDSDSAERALARVAVKGGTGLVEELTFFSLVAATPGFAEKAAGEVVEQPPVPDGVPPPEDLFPQQLPVFPDEPPVPTLYSGTDGEAVVDGGFDASRITDEVILAAVQDNWALVAGLWYNADGTPRET